MQQKHRIIEIYGLWLADLLCIGAAFFLSTYLRFGDWEGMVDSGIHYQVFLVFLLLCTVYDLAIGRKASLVSRSFWRELAAVLQYMVFLFLLAQSVMVVLKWAEVFSRLVMGYFVVINLLLTLLVHLIIKQIVRVYYASDQTAIKVLLAVQEDVGEERIKQLQEELDKPYQIVALAYVGATVDRHGQSVGEVPIVAGDESLLEVTGQMAIDEVYIKAPELSPQEIEGLIGGYDAMGVNCHYDLSHLPQGSGQHLLDEFGGHHVLTYARTNPDPQLLLLKRIIDLLGGLLGVVITIIFYPFVALAIKIESPGPVLFSQERIGRNGRRFTFYKFRSMYRDAEARKEELASQNEISGLMFKLENDPRITKVGRFLRKTSIDELPQFFNIVKGDMSLVGTRPPTADEFERYNQHYRRRISMTPGLTGLWQVSGRSGIEDFDEVVKLDLQYIDNWSLGLDMKILLKTIAVVLSGKGAK
jgi:exopolysaccharide biosynthesis polyprenyl glycosylphosphotransferase